MPRWHSPNDRKNTCAVSEFDRALAAHELVKVSVRSSDRDARNAALATLSERTSSELVQRVGHVGLFYRRRPESPKIIIPDH
jgi:RNA-binding protein